MDIDSQNCFRELIESNLAYHLNTDKADVPDHFRYELIQSVIKTYDENFDFPYHEFEKFSVMEILNYLRLTHIYYIQKKLPEIEQTVFQIFQKYNDTHKLLALLCLFFTDYKKKLEEHISFEEQKLFPYIEKLEALNPDSSSNVEISDVLNSFSARQFLNTHGPIEDELQDVRQTILKYTGNQSTPLPYRIFLSQLKYFEIELCRHAMLEDGVLMPRIIQKEALLFKKAQTSL